MQNKFTNTCRVFGFQSIGTKLIAENFGVEFENVTVQFDTGATRIIIFLRLLHRLWGTALTRIIYLFVFVWLTLFSRKFKSASTAVKHADMRHRIICLNDSLRSRVNRRVKNMLNFSIVQISFAKALIDFPGSVWRVDRTLKAITPSYARYQGDAPLQNIFALLSAKNKFSSQRA